MGAMAVRRAASSVAVRVMIEPHSTKAATLPTFRDSSGSDAFSSYDPAGFLPRIVPPPWMKNCLFDTVAVVARHLDYQAMPWPEFQEVGGANETPSICLLYSSLSYPA